MLKLLFWGIVGYIIYRYFQMRDQIKAGRKQDAVQRENQTGAEEPKRDGDYIDYEEIK